MKIITHIKKCNLLNFNLHCVLYLNLLGLYIYVPSLGSTVLRPRGASLAMASFYDPAKPFTCFDGSGTIPFSRINDDYCDCKDGTDEPGTSACLNGIFHCKNTGHIGKDITSSFVNDGVCDCCDTSDEYASEADCLDVCLALGEAAREEGRRKVEVQMRGFIIRQKMAEEGAKLKKEKQVRIDELTAEKKKAEEDHAEKAAAKEAAEEPERKALEQYKALEEVINARKAKEQKEKDVSEAQEAFDHLDEDKDGVITIQELQSKETFDTNRDGEVSEEEAKFYLQQKESMEKETFLATGWSLMKPAYKHHKRLFVPPPPTTELPEEDLSVSEDDHDQGVGEEANQEQTENEKQFEAEFDTQDEDLEEEEEEPDDYSEDDLDEGEVNRGKEVVKDENTIEYDPETQKLVDIANAAREDFRSVDDHLRDLNKEIQSLKEGLEKDFGPHDEFRTFENQCFEFADREYIYKLCPFNSAVQKPKSGHGETKLGSWGEWTGPAGNLYSAMKYTGGQVCWNGPQRSAEVRLSCGVENELTSVNEPNRCEYLFLFTTPAVCIHPEEHSHQHTEL